MPHENLLNAVKTAMKAEKDSVTVYSEAAARASGDVQAFFQERAEEEKKHFNWLLDYYRRMEQNLPPSEFRNLIGSDSGKPDSFLITDDFLRRIAGDQYLTTAIATAVLMEATAQRHYRKAAEETVHNELRDFFIALADWEDKHYRDLIKIQEESERYWFDLQRFEPF
ncbi:MAG: ferritin family protein [Spirochaetes bacterium]|nr:ferritin family protein [Spirochaetota bacterium]MBU0954922.1 ferritin family protein [Spirochaetota bacterium]